MSEEHTFDAMARIDHGISENRIKFKDKYAKLFADADAKFGTLETVITDADQAVLTALDTKLDAAESVLAHHGELKNGQYVLKQGTTEEATKLFHEAETEVASMKNKMIGFFRGEKIDGFEHTISDVAKNAFTEAEKAGQAVTKPTLGHFGMLRTQQDGWKVALKKNWNELKEFKPGTRGKAMMRGGVVVGSVFAMGDAIFRSKDSNGEDRSGAFCVLEAVGAGMVGTAAALHGSALAR